MPKQFIILSSDGLTYTNTGEEINNLQVIDIITAINMEEAKEIFLKETTLTTEDYPLLLMYELASINNALRFNI